MVDRKVRWGVISTANIARVAVIPAIQASRNGEIVGVASRDKQKAREFADKLNIPASYGTYEELVSAEDIEAVYIPLPNSMHREYAIKAAQEHKHILCEKPLAMNAAECIEMQDAARRNGVKLMEAFMYRFHPQLKQVIEFIQGGAIGTMQFIHAVFTFNVTNPVNIRLQPQLGGGALMDVGCYCVNSSRTLAGQEPVEVQAFGKWGSTGVDEQMAGSLRFANGLLAQFDCGLKMQRRESYQIVGTEGMLDIPVAFLPGTQDTIIRHRRGREETVHSIPGDDEYRLMVEHFADSILHDLPPRYLPAEAAANMRVMEALYRSAGNSGRPERVA